MRQQTLALILLMVAIVGCKPRGESGLRIVGGEPATPDQFPGSVRLDFLGCGGTVVAQRQVLTAAHCVVQEQTPRLRNDVATGRQLKIVSGIAARKSVTGVVERVDIHPSFVLSMQKYLRRPARQRTMTAVAAALYDLDAADVALITFRNQIEVVPAKIFDQPIGKDVPLFLQGYGMPLSGAPAPGDTLRYFQRPVHEQQVTRYLIAAADPQDPHAIDKRKGLSKGDSGSAAYITHEGVLVAVGVNSGGLPYEVGQNVGDFFVARIDNLAATPAVGPWLRRRLQN